MNPRMWIILLCSVGLQMPAMAYLDGHTGQMFFHSFILLLASGIFYLRKFFLYLASLFDLYRP